MGWLIAGMAFIAIAAVIATCALLASDDGDATANPSIRDVRRAPDEA